MAERWSEPTWRFVPVALDAADLEALAPLLDDLEAREVADAAGLERWLEDLSEVLSRIDGEEAERYVAWSRDTGDEAARSRHVEFQERVKSALRPRLVDLERRHLALARRFPLEGEAWRVLEREVAAKVGLFRPGLVPLETEQVRLETEYGAVSGAWTVEFRGTELTLQQLALHLEAADRDEREEAWRLSARRRLRDREALDRIFEEMLDLRRRMAIEAEKDDYRAYAFVHLKRFDYTPEECLQFHATVEARVLPAVARLRKSRRRQLGVERLRPWDQAVDPRGREPLRPFRDEAELVAGLHRVLERVDPVLAAELQGLVAAGLTDLGSRKGKAPGAYCYPLENSRLPFLFANAAGSHRDVKTLLHEGGHAFHALAAREQRLLGWRHAPIEFCEVASMGLEFLGIENLDAWYDPADAARALAEQVRSTLLLLPWIATIDAFQHWLYTHPDHDGEARRREWLALRRRFDAEVDWSGLEEEEAWLWHRQPHLYLHPFYYFEYAVAQLGALQLWARWRHEGAAAVRDYRHALALGGTRTLPELFAAAGLRFAFDGETVGDLVEESLAVLEAAGELEA